MTWVATLDGSLRDRGWQVVRDIAEALADHERPRVDLALFWTYLSSVLDDETTQARTDAALRRLTGERGLEGLAGPGLFGGLAGAGWVVSHVGEDVEPLLELVDTSLLETLERGLPGDYDLINGVVGIAVYFLERDSPASSVAFERIVARLSATCERGEEGTTWHTRPELLPDHQRERWPLGYYNCGLSHGVPGVVAVLSKIAARPGAPPAAATLRDEATRWLLAQRREHGFPSMLDAESAPPGGKTWCYGDPGVTIALWGAAARSGHATTDLDPLVRDWMNHTPHPKDPALCHGTAGLMHLCNRFYQATRDPWYADLARGWCERTLEQHRPGTGVGGFVMFDGKTQAKTWANPRLIDGTIGIGLALISALTDLEPGWDRLMLCDLPVT